MAQTNRVPMESRSLTTILIVIICVLMFPIIIGGIAGVFGILGGVLGGIFGLIGGLIGGIAGVFGSIFGVVFGFIGWLVGAPFNHTWHFFPVIPLNLIVIGVVVVLLLRARRTPGGKRRT